MNFIAYKYLQKNDTQINIEEFMTTVTSSVAWVE